jgi:arylsulfatase A-like enzyme
LQKEGITDNAPLKGGKGMLYEGGVRNSYIFRWTGKIKPGSTNHTPITSVDLYPTLVEISGATAPADYPLDGVSYAPILLAARDTLGRDSIYWHFPGYLGAGAGQWRTKPVGAVRCGDWKLMEFFEDGRLELYNLKDDIGEEHNRAGDMPDKAKELHAKLAAWREEVGAKAPTQNKNIRDDAKKAKKKNKKNKTKRNNRAGSN